MLVLISNLYAAALLIVGRAVHPERLSNTAAGAAVLIIVLAALSGVGTYLDSGSLLAAPVVSLFAVLGAFIVCAVAMPAGATGRAITGVLAVVVVCAVVAISLVFNIASDGPEWLSTVLIIVIGTGFAVAIWRLTGLLGAAGATRRGLATVGGLALMVVGVEWPLVSSVLAAPLIAAQDPGPDDFDTQYARFKDLPVTDALIDQRVRIAAQFAALPAHASGPETFVLAVGGSGYQAIFDREARRAASVLTARTPGPSVVLSNSPEQVTRGILASPRTVALAVAAIGRRAVRGDTLVMYLASHGGRGANITMDTPRLEFADLTAKALATDLQNAGIERRIIIVSACFGATWIKPLANPTTILMTAANVDRTSFGCDDSRDLTVFGEAITRELSNHHQSLAQAFARAKLRIAADEGTDHETPSQPQSWVGSAMAATSTATR